MLVRLLTATAVASLFVGCTAEKPAPTYTRDVAPIIDKNCVACHRAGGVGPFELTSYEQVNGVREMVKAAVVSRMMPPSNLDASGDCQEYKDARWLTDEEIDTIARWVDTGAEHGNDADRVETPPAIRTLADDAIRLEMPEAYMPKGGEEQPNDDYRCFMFEHRFAAEEFLTAYEVLPDQAQQFHHMILFAIESDEGEAVADQLDADDPGPGWDCLNTGEIEDAVLLGVWAPGISVTRYPAGTGIKVPAGHRLGMQVHYNLLTDVRPDRSALRVEVADTVQKEAVLSPLVHDDFELPPGEPSVVTSMSLPLFGFDFEAIEVHGVFPHMHLLGRSLQFERFPTLYPEQSECMADVPSWDFHWQETNFYKEPVLITPDDSLRITCEFDTRSRETPTFFGDGTEDEMCLVFTYLTLRDGGPLEL